MLGFETNDDAAVYRINDEVAALTTVDFFTPIVDDPYDFGRITAANALSDIYAMGGVPLTVLNLLAFPCSLGAEVAGAVVRGGADVVRRAGALTVGGHTIDDKEPKYGLSVFGTVHPDRVWLNRGAKAGDVVILTKPIGTGIWGTALKRGVYTEAEATQAIESMATLNKCAAEKAHDLTVHACTDVTGFGLAGHLHEMAEASSVDAEVALDIVPLLDGAKQLAADNVVPGKTTDLIEWAADFVSFDDTYTDDEQNLWLKIALDPQTSGGLMFAMPKDDAGVYLQRMGDKAVAIGTFMPKQNNEGGHIQFI